MRIGGDFFSFQNSLSWEDGIFKPKIFSRGGGIFLISFFSLVLASGLFYLGFSIGLRDLRSYGSASVLSADARPLENLYFRENQSYIPIHSFPEAKIIERKIVIDLSDQMFYCYEGGQLVRSFITSTGKSSTPTKMGNFEVQTKLEWAYGGAQGMTWAMPYWLGIYYAGSTQNGIHGLPYINGVKESPSVLGHPGSFGCIRLSDEAIIWVYNWADIGTPVEIQW